MQDSERLSGQEPAPVVSVFVAIGAPTVPPLRAIAAARLVASYVLSPETTEKFVPVSLLAPPLSAPAPQSKPVSVSLRVMLLPAAPSVLAVSVTVLVPPELAVTPAAIGQRLIAAARFVASVVAVLLIIKVPLVELGQVFEPLE